MVWHATDILTLRRRLGWTQADLARRLGCRVDDVKAWENSDQNPETEYANRLEHLMQHCEATANAVSQQSTAESILRERGLEQITKDELAK